MHVVTQGMPEAMGYSPGLELGAGGAIDNASSTANAKGAIYLDQAGSSFLYVGSATDIWERQASASVFADVSATTYATSTRWEFTRWKSDVLATNFHDPIQTKTPVLNTTVPFADLNANAPRARTITAARNFVIIGNTFDTTDNTSTARVRWSALNDATSWTVSAATQADYQDLEKEGGDVQRVFGGEYCVVFQERAITRMSYVGAPQVWQFDEIERNKGLLDPKAAAQIGNKIFYLSELGFEVVVDGSESVPIGNNQVNDFFLQDYDATYDVIACADRKRPRVYWNYMDVNSGGARYKGLAYDYSLNKWGAFSLLTDLTPTVTAIEVGAMVPGTPLSGVDIAVLYSDNFLGAFADFTFRDADAFNTIDMTTGRVALSPGRNSTVHSVELGWGEVDTADTATATVTVTGYSRAASFSGATTTAATGSARVGSSVVSVRKRGRFHDFKVTLTPDDVADATNVINRPVLKWIGVNYSETGKR